MVILNADNGHVVATPTIGYGPDACAYDPAKSLVFSANGKDGTVTVLQQTTPDQYDVVQTVNTQSGAWSLFLLDKAARQFGMTEVLPGGVHCQSPPAGLLLTASDRGLSSIVFNASFSTSR